MPGHLHPLIEEILTKAARLVPHRDYGTNNPLAYSDACPVFGKHKWRFEREISRCYTEYGCDCGASHRVDSGD